MTKINLHTHTFGNQITPEHPFITPAETVTKDVIWNPLPEFTVVKDDVDWHEEPAGPSETDLLIADLVEQLRVAESERDMFLSLYREKCSQLWEARMSAWAKFKRWFRLQWNYDIYDEHLKG